ncbi:MAG: sulfotransferase domain-containing protein [Bacteroidia bacterium]|nr:sulfotransferase domain-containing protein [Bacteroidia bacterium]
MAPDFVGIGTQKCATAWLYAVLSEHPEISMAQSDSGNKNLFFFDHFFDRGYEWYKKYYQDHSKKVFGEFSTSYIYNKSAPERIFNYRPDIKLIVSLRHPVERAYSNHKHEIMRGRVTGENIYFENALSNNPMYLNQSLYFTHLSEWLKYFPREQLLVLLVDDIKKSPEKVIEELYTFVGVDPDFMPTVLSGKVHETKLVKKNIIIRTLRKTSLFFMDYGFNWFLKLIKKTGIKKLILKHNTLSKEDAFPKMKESTRKKLLKFFKEENEKLSQLLDINLNQWNL